MPELPEVETVRRSLLPHLVGHRVLRVSLHRADIVTGRRDAPSLLAGQRITEIRRHGKQLALISEAGRAVCVHLGMTGQLRASPPPPEGSPVASVPPSHAGGKRFCASADAGDPPHTHITWHLDDGGRCRFTDPRRFGGLWTFASYETLRDQRWFRLGPDALLITPKPLHQALQRTCRPVKAALLDQQVIAGLGNIYVDELLFACGIHPQCQAHTVSMDQSRQLVRAMRRLLNRAIGAGGSTLRDYVDGTGKKGGYQQQHKVYGRAGELCTICGQPLEKYIVAGRTTIACESCQPIAA